MESMLKREDLKKLLNIASKAGKEAGEYILNKKESFGAVFSKESGSLASSVFTEVDINSQNIILSYLQGTMEEYNLGLLAEEGDKDDSRFKSDYFWAVDPLDGSLPFINSTPGFSVSICLVSKSGKSLLGVVYNPTTGDLYSALRGEGTFKNSKRIIKKRSSSIKLFLDKSFLSDRRLDLIVKSLEERLNREAEIVTLGGAVLNAVWSMEETMGLYFKLPKESPGGGSIWDFAATSILMEEAGGYVSDIYGRSLDLNSRESTYMNRFGVVYSSSREGYQALLDSVKKVVDYSSN